MAIDYKKFLNKSEELVLPFLGTPRLSGENRTFRLKQAPEQPGWFRFKIQGRLAEPLGPADPPDLAKLPKVRMDCTIKIGRPINVERYRNRGEDHLVLRQITDELMFEIRELTGQEYRNVYAGGTNVPERHPEHRQRRDAFVRLNHALPNRSSVKATAASAASRSPTSQA